MRFPVGISYGAVGGPGHDTAIVSLPASGAEERTSRRDGAKRIYDAAKGVSSQADAAAILDFVLARAGSARGFRFKDWFDFTSASDHRSAVDFDDQVIGTGDGVTTEFQLRKTYQDTARTVQRLIEKPVSGTTRIGVAGVEAMAGWTVNTTSGLVTFSVAPALGEEITAGFQFDVPVRFDDSIDKWMKFRIDSFANSSVPSIICVELLNENWVDDDFFYGGGTSWNPLSANISLTPLNGRSIVVNPNAAGRTITLPDPTDLATGGPYFFIINQSATDTVALLDEAATTIATIAVSSSIIVVLTLQGSTKVWMAL